jgi:hypothetical protein
VNYEEDEDESDDEVGGPAPDLMKSYLAFGRRAVSKRLSTSALVLAIGLCLTVVLTLLWPRTYHCETRLFAQHTNALHSELERGALSGASDVILDHDNLEKIIKTTDLLRLWTERRPPLQRARDALLALVGKKPDAKALDAQLLWMLGDRLRVDASDNNLNLSIDWSDGQTAALLLKAAEDSFLEARHVQEISETAEYISILEEHAANVRSEVETIANQMSHYRDNQFAEAKKKLDVLTAAQVPAAAPAPRTASPRPRASAEPDEDLVQLKASLDQKKADLAQLDQFRSGKLREAQSKLADLENTYTDAHPIVVEAKSTVLRYTGDSPEETALRADIKSLEAQIKARTDMPSIGRLSGGALAAAVGKENAVDASAAPLSQQVMDVLQDNPNNIDPAVRAQFSYAVSKYAELREKIVTSRIELDTAQAAFKHRYQVVVPPEVPTKAAKPKLPLLIGAGVVLALLLALAVPVLAELRTGKIVETWQVHSLVLPVLAELSFPPARSDSDPE